MNKKVRAFIKSILTEENHRFDFLMAPKVTLGKIDWLYVQNKRIRKESSAQIHRQESLDFDFTLATLAASAMFALSASLRTAQDCKSILPPQWINIEDKPNANFVFGILVTQLTQLSHSLLELIDKGFDNGARIILRSIIELTWQILILLFYREDLRKFVKAGSFEEVNTTWRELFGRKRFTKKIIAIEEELNIDPERRTARVSELKDDYRFFSESVHHGYVSSCLATMQMHSDEDKFSTCFLGGACARSQDTLRAFVYNSMYFLDIFYAIITKYHGTNFEDLPELYWKDSLVLTECIRECIFKRASGDL